MHYLSLSKRFVAVLTALVLVTLGAASAAHAVSTPTVTDFSQNGADVDLQGTGLSVATNVLFDKTSAASFQNVSDKEVMAVAPNSLSAGHHEIWLVTPSGNIDTGFSFVMAPPAPKITSVSPSSGPTTGGTKIVVLGSGFSFLTNVAVGGPVQSDVAISDSEIDIVTAPHAPGKVELAITTLGGTALDSFTYVAPPVAANAALLTISSVAPNHGFIGGNTGVKIFGSGFNNVKSVKFFGKNAKTFKVVSNTEIDALSPMVAKGGIGLLTVSNGTSSASTVWVYRYVKPWITNVSPNNGSSSTLHTVTIHGFGFTGVSSVFLNGVPVKIVNVQDKTITVQLPKHHDGKVWLCVFNPAGVSNASPFSYN